MPPDEATKNTNQCQHVWVAADVAGSKYAQQCSGCGARCNREPSGKICEYDRGVKLPEGKRS